ncbi:srs domain-containing protein [Cystoisospora suis]|uniref:Srs domain-containing protein n=1 Tax=Cystoisospora suis TaxID=483139 RepID=A0A2C6KV44_9APIC|nr:srs domain-containing protein [Cystoisospora suis]
MAWPHRHRPFGGFLLVSCLFILCTRCIAGGASGEAGNNVQTCDDTQKIQLEISGKSPVTQFKCDTKLTVLLPKIADDSSGNKCYTNPDCTLPGPLPDGVAITVDNAKQVHTIQTTKVPTADAAAYFLCTDNENQPSKKCTVELQIKGSPAVSEERRCTKAGQTVNIRLTAPTNEVTFACESNLTTLAPAAPTDVFSDESCAKETKLDTLIPKATLTPGTGLEKQRHTLAIPTFPEKTTTLCYKCQGQNPAEACKVVITVDGTSATSTTTSSTSGSRSVMAGAGGLAVVWVAALFTGILYGR